MKGDNACRDATVGYGYGQDRQAVEKGLARFLEAWSQGESVYSLQPARRPRLSALGGME